MRVIGPLSLRLVGSSYAKLLSGSIPQAGSNINRWAGGCVLVLSSTAEHDRARQARFNQGLNHRRRPPPRTFRNQNLLGEPREFLLTRVCVPNLIIISGTDFALLRWMIRGRRLFGLAVRAASSQASGHLPLSTLKRPSIDAVQDFAERIRLIGAGTVGPVYVYVP